jgi:hypothetical protein
MAILRLSYIVHLTSYITLNSEFYIKMKISFILSFFSLVTLCCFSQTTAVINPRALSADEYTKAKAFRVKDLDKDTYVKFENKFVLDRYEMRKPYFITGDDGLKKRIDLYKLYSRDSMQEIGLVIFYTSEKGNLFSAVQPSAPSDAAVWAQYFEDIHAIDKEEKNFVLKLSYVLSKEMSFQLYKGLNKNAAASNVTYGTEICFPGHQLVTMANGTSKYMSEIIPGDKVLTVDPITKAGKTVLVKELTQHEASNYAIVQLILIAATEHQTDQGTQVSLSSKLIEATPNHPVETISEKKRIGDITEGEQLFCYDEKKKEFCAYTVVSRTELSGTMQKVYNVVAAEGETIIVNNVMVRQK